MTADWQEIMHKPADELEDLKAELQEIKKLIPVVFQCCYCRLPERGEHERVSHGICDPCMEIHHPNVKKEKVPDPT